MRVKRIMTSATCGLLMPRRTNSNCVLHAIRPCGGAGAACLARQYYRS